MITHVRKMVCLVILLSACASQTSTPSLTSATTTQATLSPIPSTTVPTPTSLPDGDLVYGDPRGRFSMPLAGGWTPVATDESFGHFRLADPALELYVIAVESNDLLEASEAALAQIGLDPAALAQPDVLDLQHWTILVYPTDSGQGVSLAARAIEGATVAVILSGDLKVIAAPPQEALLTLDGFGFVPLSEYVEFQTPPAPRTVADIQDLNDIVFYNGRTPLRGKLVVPEGDGPFPAIVCVHGSGPERRDTCDHAIPALRSAGLAIFSFDKRGVGQSEGLFLGVTDIFGDPSPSEWRLPQLADDVLAAVAFLRNLQGIDPDAIGLIGASQAGSIIPQVAAQSDVPAFAVVVAGQTVSVGEAHYYQQFTDKERRLPPMTESERGEISAQLATFAGDRGYDPRPSIRAMEISALWIWGDLDGWIPPRVSRLELESAVAEHELDFTILYDADYGHEWPSSWTSQAVDWILAHLADVP